MAMNAARVVGASRLPGEGVGVCMSVGEADCEMTDLAEGYNGTFCGNGRGAPPQARISLPAKTRCRASSRPRLQPLPTTLVAAAVSQDECLVRCHSEQY